MDPNQLFSSDFLGEIFGLNGVQNIEQFNVNQVSSPFFDPNIVQVDSPLAFVPTYNLQPQQQATTFALESSNSLIQSQINSRPNHQTQLMSNSQPSPLMTIKSEVVEISSRTNQPKRKQVARACSNCRKVHTACDSHRPCKRCILYGLNCIDPPRKKREPKKPKIEPVIPTNYLHSYNSLENNNNSNLDFSSSPQPFDNQSPNSLTLIQPNNSRYLYQPDMYDSVTKMTEAINRLSQEMAELKHSNKALETRLSHVTQELDEVKVANTPKTIQLFPTSKWYSFHEQADLSISVWRPQMIDNKKKLVLTECNGRFKQLVGYSDEVLSNAFTANQLIDWQSEICPRFRENFGTCDNSQYDFSHSKDDPSRFKPISLRTQIKSVTGFKDVMITLQPIRSYKNELKYFLMHMLEIHKDK